MTTTGPDDREPPVGADVDRAWRALSREEPPASLDASILAAARRAAGAHPQAIDAKEAIAARRRWWPLAAAATVAVIAVGVLQLTPPEHLGAPSTENATVSDMPAPPGKKPEAVPAAPAVKADAAPAAPAVSAEPAPPTDSRRDREALRQRQEARPAPPASPAPPPAPEPFPAAPKRVDEGANVSAVQPPAPPAQSARKEAPAPAPLPEPYVIAPPAAVVAPPVAAGSVAAEQAAAAPGAAAPTAKMAASRAAEASGAARIKDRVPLSVPDWIALIRRLRDEGQTAEAAKELAAFRTAHADHEKLLPPDLRDWHPLDK